ncbi:MAG: hypothetical protein IKJ87_01210 [Ruminococcus sp.]|nr:hypothetical protein [Ruminococcus sp.]
MDEIIITSAVILTVIAIIEIVTLFFSLPAENAPPYVTVLPVFCDDELFDRRIEYLMQRGCGRRSVIIIDYSATDSQKKLCRRFIENNPDAVFVRHDELEGYFSSVFLAAEKNDRTS